MPRSRSSKKFKGARKWNWMKEESKQRYMRKNNHARKMREREKSGRFVQEQKVDDTNYDDDDGYRRNYEENDYEHNYCYYIDYDSDSDDDYDDRRHQPSYIELECDAHHDRYQDNGWLMYLDDDYP